MILTLDDVSKPDFQTVYHVAQGAQAQLLTQIARLQKSVTIFVTTHDKYIEAHAASLSFLAPELPVLRFPAWDCLPYDRVSPNASIMAERIGTLSTLLNWPAGKPLILLTTVNAITQKVMPKSALKQAVFSVKVGDSIAQNKLLEYCTMLGFQRVGKVMEPGEFAARGSLVDVFAPGMESACRIDWFGDEVESIRTFEPLSQRTDGTLKHFSLMPASEVLLNQAAINNFRDNYRTTFGAVNKIDGLYEAISQGRVYTGMEHWLPLFYPHLNTLLDYAPKHTLVLDMEIDHTRADREESIADYYDTRKLMREAKSRPLGDEAEPYFPLPPQQFFIQGRAWDALIADSPTLSLSSFSAPDNKANARLNLDTKPMKSYASERKDGSLWEAVKADAGIHSAAGRQVVVACASAGAAERMKQMLITHGMAATIAENAGTLKHVEEGALAVAIWPLDRGFLTPTLAVISEQDILGDRIGRPTKKRKPTEYFMAEAASFAEGDLIVHREHGLGRFVGLVNVEAGGAQHDCLKLLYAGDDKLFIPVENIDILSRYGAEDEESKLDHLGGVSWQNRKARLKEKILLAAEELLKTAAQRELQVGTPFTPHPEYYEEFARRFPYAETDDQEKSIEDVLADLSAGRPMDRLVCGDVGFGKTEVALRAAAAVACAETNPAQVALIAPTTLLARQHYAGFKKRFDGMPVTVRQLSRFTTPKQMEEARAGLKDGTVNIVVGTHALLSKQVEFKNLGLLIVDEEQHFGVAQKEKLKALRANLHVLTLSATPIPRTLQMALTGVRDLSLITTPPVDRLAVRTFVMPFDGLVIKEAIQRERHRGGQVFYVTPRIHDLAELEVRIKDLVPDIKLAVAHGQMPAAKLDKLMTEFDAGKYELLLSTSIVESGLDIPNANTLIVNRADQFGLAQLYQLRGRVGRGKTRAYAYFTLQHHRVLSTNAMKRLEVMQTLDTLGAGFTVASHDMDIRGFGNLLGEEQSGHVREVGVELYQQMLEEAVEAARRGKKEISGTEHSPSEERWSPHINLGLSVLIPEHYVSDLETRMGLYRRSGTLNSAEEIEGFAAELIDRFGPLPEEVTSLLHVLHTKHLCRLAGIEKLETGPKGFTITFRPEATPLSPEAILRFVATRAGKAKIRPDNKLVILDEWKSQKQKLETVDKALKDLLSLQEARAA